MAVHCRVTQGFWLHNLLLSTPDIAANVPSSRGWVLGFRIGVLFVALGGVDS